MKKLKEKNIDHHTSQEEDPSHTSIKWMLKDMKNRIEIDTGSPGKMIKGPVIKRSCSKK